MRRAHTVPQVRDAEADLMRSLPDGVLMQRAATGLAHAVLDLLGGGYGHRVLLLVGSGDNGGDALHAGCALLRRGSRVAAVLLGGSHHEEGLAAFTAAGGSVVDDVADAPRPDVVVDGIVGIGGRPGLRPEAVAALAALSGVPVVAVDVPSGVDVDTGELDGPHVVADLTVTFGTHKVAHLVGPAAGVCGAVHLVDLGLELPPAVAESLQPEDVAALVPRPGPDDHKYTRGVVGVRAGSETYPGAALLCVAGASSGLVGMVRYVGSAADRVRVAHPEVVGDGRVQAWVVGPGGGDEAAEQLAAVVGSGVPVLVDADGLAHVRPGQAAVLTPHAGELARMLDTAREDVEARPLAHARLAAERYDAVLLLKGRHTLVVAPDGRTRVTTTGLPWLATAGAGDVLSGLIGALLAAGLDPWDAASVGSWLHGAAATLASGGGPLVAGDVAAALPAVVRSLP
ncbi:carbohydrate kinase [Nocardioides sp. Soil777]|uniref:bifunctional ADP-dependent NAD(P)H-hydrate dehydratase/NAD(P)H-hydrate epimerase n=1 Tax=Nocardioides sp. Soil777 TaxID=1736409 RepID=UPI00070292DC|nr:bifunctional ADP-dependent NAD(P)H-hydrate dehydratase/NAD(P)H-hydrate epimerase [Nocardioides sp. Soil777]KRF02862.1 carbohydrate kinase [Nocardioides sp. Soil777]